MQTDDERITNLADIEFLAKARLLGINLMFFPESDTSSSMERLEMKD
jgi:hypothetical protein